MSTVAHAASSPTDFSSFVDNWIDTAEQGIIPLIVGAATVCFLWGVALYLRSAGDEKSRTEGLAYMWWGIVGLVVIFGVWGFVGLLTDFFDTEVGIPQF